MCGRFALSIPLSKIAEYFEALNRCDLTTSFNIAPTQDVACLINDGEKKIVTFKWGLVPSWAKDPSIGYKMINARSETVAEKPSYRNALKKRRCIIVADGFYEWKHVDKIKTPYFIHLKDNIPFGFAGLYEHWEDTEGKVIDSCTIITTDANDLVKSIHNRMPVILDKEQANKWIDMKLDSIEVLPYLTPYPPELMQMYEVSPLINSLKLNSPDCIKPV